MNILSLVEKNQAVLILALACAILILCIILVVQRVKIGKLNKKYNTFMKGNNGESLEEIILNKLAQIDQLSSDMTVVNEQLATIKETLLTSYQKMSIVKYDAFKEMGGKLSFVLALLDEQNSGFVINAMHSSREGCYTYAKEIIHGESFVMLSNEEKQAIEEAMNRKNYME